MNEIRVWKIVLLNMVTTSEQERDKWIAAGHEVVEFVSIDRIKELESQLAEAKKDQARLDFVLNNNAFKVTLRNEKFQLMTQDEDENYLVLSGNDKSFSTAREAIDAAIASKEQGK
jgi:hypothetical protein